VTSLSPLGEEWFKSKIESHEAQKNFLDVGEFMEDTQQGGEKRNIA
jgi:hypothetical protein